MSARFHGLRVTFLLAIRRLCCAALSEVMDSSPNGSRSVNNTTNARHLSKNEYQKLLISGIVYQASNDDLSILDEKSDTGCIGLG